MVTHRPEEKVANVVSFVEGYPLKEGSDASLDIGGSKFSADSLNVDFLTREASTNVTPVPSNPRNRPS